MNLVDMLLNKPIPPSLYAPPTTETGERYVSPAQREAWKRNTVEANKARMKAGEERYRKVMTEWLTQGQIEDRLGLARCVANPMLKRLEKEGKAERKWLDGRSSVWKWKE